VIRFASVALALTSTVTAPAQPPRPWREAPEFLRLFAPTDGPGARPGVYRAYVSPLEMDAALERLREDGSLLRPPGAWEPRTRSPLDAFGQTGPYNRWQLLRLYGGRAPRVARGPRAENGRIVESWTLISPHPDATLQQLQPGTLLLVLKLP
jgi:hypothetical protein